MGSLGGPILRRLTAAAMASVVFATGFQGPLPAAAAKPAVKARAAAPSTAHRFLAQRAIAGRRLPTQAVITPRRSTAAAPLGGAAWKPLGPQSITGLETYGPSAGRVTALAAKGSVVYAGAADGGVWRSPDGGQSWLSTTDSLPTLAIGALAVDWSSAPETVYGATGEGNSCLDCLPGQGLLKSTDGGTTWTLYGQASLAGTVATGIAVNGQTVVLTTHQGLFQSNDGGLSWPSTPTVAGSFDSISQDPGVPNRFWAAMTTDCVSSPTTGTIGIWNSALTTWTPSSTPVPPVAIARIGLGAGPNGTVYASLAACPSNSAGYADGQLVEVLKGVNGVWTTYSPGSSQSPSLKDYFQVFAGQDQGWYDNVVAVDPNDASGNTAIFGGVTMLTTTNGGASFSDVANPYGGGPLHPDFHAVAFTGPGSFYAGNDGGVYATSDLGGDGTATHWRNLSANLPITQFYAGSSPDLNHLAGGSQDNGTAGNPQGQAPSTWLSLLGSDGGWTAMLANSRTMFGEASGLDIYQFDYSGAGTAVEVAPCSAAHSSDPACSDPVGFTAPFVVDPTSTAADSARLYAATNKVYRTTTGGLPNGGTISLGGSWDPISGDLTTRTGSGTNTHVADWVNTMAIGSAKYAGTVMTGSWFGKVFLTTNADAGAPAWIDVTGNLPSWSKAASSGNAWITGLAINPINAKEAWVTVGTASGSRVWHTTDAALKQWTDESSTLPPNLVVDSITVDPIMPQNVYIGTDTGTLACASCGDPSPVASWVPLGSGGLPNVKVDALTITSDDLYLVAWTHGRGAWYLPRPYPTPGGRLDPPTVSFGSQTVGTMSSLATVTLTSTGTAPLVVSTVSIGGDFVLDQGSQATPCPRPSFTLPPGAQCNFGVRFEPRAIGSRTGTLSVADNAANSPQSTLFDGTGVGGWHSLGGYILSGPQATSSSFNRLDLFVRGSDNGLWHRSFNGSTWTNWEPLGGVMASDPAAVNSGNGQIDVFTRGTDNHLWRITYNGTNWNRWSLADPNGILTSAPTVCSPSAGRLDLFVRGTDNGLWHKTFANGSSTPFTNADGAGGVLDSEPSAVSWGGGRMDVFIRGTDQQLWHMSSTDSISWHPWRREGDGLLNSRPEASTWGANRLDVFIKGTDNQLWHIWTNDGGGSWANWTNAEARGGILGSGPAATGRTQGLNDVFIRGTDSAVWYITIPGS